MHFTQMRHIPLHDIIALACHYEPLLPKKHEWTPGHKIHLRIHLNLAETFEQK